MARRRTATGCRTRADGAVVHRTAPIVDGDGRYLGATCHCGRALTTASGGASQPQRVVGPFVRVVDSRAHRDRVTHARRARKRAKKAGRR